MIVPEEPVELPVGEAIALTARLAKAEAVGNANESADQDETAGVAEQTNSSDLPYDEWLERFRNLPLIVTDVHVPLDAMKRENIYDERK